MRLAKFEMTTGEVVRFLATWLLVGFASGTATLLGPVRWITDFTRGAGWSAGAEKAIVVTIIAAYVVASFVLTLVLLGGRSRSAEARRMAIVLAVVAAGAALWLWMTPTVVNGLLRVELTTAAAFTFGPYPDEERFEQLRSEGFTAIVSLLHPAVVPFEPRLLERERELAERFGIELIHAPMLPWVSDNDESLAMIRELAATGDGRYYVHCYLGRDRVGTVRALVQRVAGRNGVVTGATQAVDFEASSAFQEGAFERGPIYKLSEGVFLGPYPTDEEFLAFVVSGAFSYVVSLLDPDNPQDHQWIKKEQTVLKKYGVPSVIMPIRQNEFDVDVIRRMLRDINDLPGPVYVHGFRSDGSTARALLEAARTGIPAIPARLFSEAMSGGSVQIVGPAVVLGPRPAGSEFGSYLERKGLRGILFVGAADHPAVEHDRVIVESETSMRWQRQAADPDQVLAVLADGGPWYVYGPGLGRVQDQIEAAFGSASTTSQAGR